ncbi:hypothetical protein PINS_up005422 [Pythium insidiosum]|nr:hypothetical protein PINS_up005422 [Pythium insidiosum]
MKAWIKRLRFQRKRESQITAAVAIQRVYRGHLGRVLFNAEKHRQLCDRGSRLIQRVYRGFRARQQYKRDKREMTRAARMLQRAYRGRNTRKLYEISQAAAALKARERYDRSILGMIDAKRNPMDELYRRAKLPREKEVFQQVKDKWEANTIVEQRAARKLRREVDQLWAATSEVIDNHYAVRRKLYGVTENVYVSHCEFEERKQRNASLKTELTDLQARIAKCKDMLRGSIASRRMLDGDEIKSIMRSCGLLLDEPTVPAPRDNQRDA